jgi:hypothetical protein
MTNGLLIYGEIFAFPHILGRPSSYVTLQLLRSEFPYILGKFDFLFHQCGVFLLHEHSPFPNLPLPHPSVDSIAHRKGGGG